MKKIHFILFFIILTLVSFVFYSTDAVEAAPFFKCPDGYSLERERGRNEGAQYFYFRCRKPDDATIPRYRRTPVPGFFDAAAVCPSGTQVYVQRVDNDGGVYWVYCTSETDGGDGPFDPQSSPPTSIAAPTGPSDRGPAVCYRRDVRQPTGGGVDSWEVQVVSCGANFERRAQEEFGYGIRDGYCYIITTLNGGTFTSGPSAGTRPITESIRGSDICQEAREISEMPGGVLDPPGAPTGGATGRFTCSGDDCVNNNPITLFIIKVINVLSAGVGIIAVAMIVVGGIQYTTSGGNPQMAAAAKKRIINAAIALAAFFFLFAALNWLIPGGLFR